MKEGIWETRKFTHPLQPSLLFRAHAGRGQEQLVKCSQYLGPLWMCLLQGPQSSACSETIRRYTTAAWSFNMPGLPGDLTFPIRSSWAPQICCKEGVKMLGGRDEPCRGITPDMTLQRTTVLLLPLVLPCTALMSTATACVGVT